MACAPGLVLPGFPRREGTGKTAGVATAEGLQGDGKHQAYRPERCKAREVHWEEDLKVKRRGGGERVNTEGGHIGIHIRHGYEEPIIHLCAKKMGNVVRDQGPGKG